MFQKESHTRSLICCDLLYKLLMFNGMKKSSRRIIGLNKIREDHKSYVWPFYNLHQRDTAPYFICRDSFNHWT